MALLSNNLEELDQHLFAVGRISDHSSILQAELFAIKGALSHALSLSQKCIYILTDSLSAIHALQKFPPANKIHLLTTVLPGATIG